MTEADITQLRLALNTAILALDDWTNTYASDFCDEKRVVEAWARIKKNGGTIAYVCDAVTQCKEARDLL